MITITIPMRNEERFISACLDSVMAQTVSLADVEILCVDGASTDKTRSVVNRYAAADDRVRLVDNPHGTVPYGMNMAIRQSRGDVIVRLDCHARYARDYIARCLEVLERTGADNVGGYLETATLADTPTSRAIVAATTSRFGVGDSAFRTGGEEQEVDTVPFGCFRREVFDRFGLYDERLDRNQDIELNSRIREGGGRIVISPLIRLTYYTRSTYAGLRQQAFHNGLWNPYTLYLTGGGLRLRHLVPLGFVLSCLILAVLSVGFQPARWLLAMELVSYSSAAGAVSVKACRQARTPPLLVFLALLQLHVAYGLGSLWGVLTVLSRFGLNRGRRVAGKAAVPPCS